MNLDARPLLIPILSVLTLFHTSCDKSLDNTQATNANESIAPILEGSESIVDTAIAKPDSVVIVDFYSNS